MDGNCECKWDVGRTAVSRPRRNTTVLVPAVADKCRTKNKNQTRNLHSGWVSPTVSFIRWYEQTRKIAPLIFACEHHFWLCSAHVRQTGFRRGQKNDPDWRKLFSSSLPKKKFSRTPMMLSRAAAFLGGWTELKAKQTSGRREFEMLTNYLLNWNDRRLHCIVMTGPSLEKSGESFKLKCVWRVLSF